MPTPDIGPSGLLKTREFASRLRVSPQSLRDLTRTNPRFPRPIQLNARTWRWHERDVTAFIESESARLGGAK